VDVIGCPVLYARLHDRLVRGYIMDALGSAARGRTISTDAAQYYLDEVSAAGRVDSPTVGAGRYAVLAEKVVGGELTDGDRHVHLSAFPVEPRTRRASGGVPLDAPISPPSRRRRRS
jgi:hypothetical protein